MQACAVDVGRSKIAPDDVQDRGIDGRDAFEGKRLEYRGMVTNAVLLAVAFVANERWILFPFYVAIILSNDFMSHGLQWLPCPTRKSNRSKISKSASTILTQMSGSLFGCGWAAGPCARAL